MYERNDYNSIPMQIPPTSLQNLINKFEEIKDLDYMVQIMILRGEAEKLLQQEREQIFSSSCSTCKFLPRQYDDYCSGCVKFARHELQDN